LNVTSGMLLAQRRCRRICLPLAHPGKRGQRSEESWKGGRGEAKAAALPFLPLRRLTTAVVFEREEENWLSGGRSGGRDLGSQALGRHLKVVLSRPRPRRTSIWLKLRVELRRSPRYGGMAGRALTNGNPGGNDPRGNFADRSPALSWSAASRKAARKRPSFPAGHPGSPCSRRGSAGPATSSSCWVG
jgi:hypothetical protein